MNQVWWYSARASGIVAWVLLAASVVWGLILSTKLRELRRGRGQGVAARTARRAVA